MKALAVFTVALAVTLVTGQGSSQGGTEFGPFENDTHRCDFDCSRAMDLALIVDASGSIKKAGADNWDKVIDFVLNIIDNFNIGPLHTHIAIETFSTRGLPRIFLNKHMDKDELKAEILKNKEKWYQDGTTNTYEALLKMRTEIFSEENGDRPHVPNVAIVITDGRSSHHERPDQFKDPIPQAQLAEAEGISVYVVGVTNGVLESELQAISKSPHLKGESYWNAPDFDTIMSVMQTLLQKTCVAICVPKNLVCENAIDLAFVVDASGSIQLDEEKLMDPPQNSNWWLIMGFLKNVIDKFTIGPNNVQVAVVTFSNLGITRVKLNQYADAASLKAATNEYGWYGDGRTNTWEGLNKMRTEVFNEANGDRPTVPNVAIVLTDGKSSHKAKPGKYKDPLPEAQLAKDEGIHIFGLGVTKDVDFKELEGIASRPKNPDDETVFSALDFDKLTEVLQFFLEEVVDQSCRYE